MTIDTNAPAALLTESWPPTSVDLLRSFPAYIGEHLHRASVELPLAAAAVLRQDRQCVSAAVHAFYYRDPLDLRACRQPEFFPPEDLVSWQVG